MELEMSMYQHDDNGKPVETKKTMHLDFASENTKQHKYQNLSEQEKTLLKLGSPELEKMLINQNGHVGTTPTPSSFMLPSYVTDEQEAYARGFVEALAELHQTPGGTSSANTTNNNTSATSNIHPQSSSTYSTLTPMSNTVISQPNMGYMNTYTGHPTVSRRHPPFAPSGLTVPNLMNNIPQQNQGNYNMVKSEPQSYADHTVPRSPDSSRVTDSPDGHSSSSIYDHVENVNRLDAIPVDLEEQEKIKLERKRARNRIAARKCRTRKLERIGRLEEKVAGLKAQNNELAQHSTGLQEQVMHLKQQIMDHVNKGCNIALPEALRYHQPMMH